MLHLQQRGQFLLGQHSNLKIEVGASVCLPGHAVLADEHKDGQQHAFRRDHQSQYSERKRIERFHAGNQVQVDGAPGQDQQDLQQQKGNAADKFGDGIGILKVDAEIVASMFNCVGCAASSLIGLLFGMDTSDDYQRVKVYRKAHAK